MSNGNPIKASDLFQDDGALSKAITDLEQMREVYKSLLKEISKSADEVMNKLKGVNTSTEEGQRTTRKAMTDAEKLKKAQKDYVTSLNETNTAIRALKKAKQDAIRQQKLEAKYADAAEGSYDKLSAQYSLNKIKLNAMSKAQRSATKDGQALEKQTREIYEEMDRLQKATGKHQLSVGNYGIATANLHPILGRLNMGLEAMGTNLDDLTTGKDPFGNLRQSIVNFGKATMAFMLSPIGMVITALGALYLLISRNKDTVLKFNSDLIDVGKTTGLAGDELEELGDDVVKLSRRLKVVGTPALMEYAKVAGQLGVKGRQNILLFTESLAKLETASDITGDEGATNIARLLTLTDGGVQNVKSFSDEIVNLGNNTAATENEILSNSTAIAQNIGQYEFGRKYVLAYGAATKAVGIEAELTGSTVGRTLGEFEKALRTGKGLEVLVRTTGKSAEELKAQFKDDAAGVFTDFIRGLNKINEEGGSVNEQLENIGIVAIRDQRVLGSLATRGFGELEKSIRLTTDATGALDAEFDAASGKLEAQLSRMGIAWDNLVLSIENGEGVFGKTFAFLAGVVAKAIEDFTQTIQFSSAIVGGFVNMMKSVRTEAVNMVKTLALINEIELDPLNPKRMFKTAKAAFNGIIEQGKQSGENLGNAFAEGFKKTLGAMTGASKETKDALKNATDDIIDENIKASIETVGEINTAISDLQKQLDNVSTRDQAEPIQKQIADLEKKRNAILGVAEANLKEAESRATQTRRAEIDVMAEGEAKDIATLEMELEEKRNLWKKYGLDLTALDAYEARERKKINDKYRAEEKAAIEKAAQEAAQAKQQAFGEGSQVIDQQKALADSEIDLLKTTEAEKTKLRLKAERDRLQKIIDLNKEVGGILSELQLQQMKNVIAKLDEEIGAVGEGKEGRKDMFDLLGIKLDNDEKAAVSEAVNFAIQNVRAMMQARIDAADAVLRKRQEETDEAKNYLQQEMDAREEGYANNVATAQKELELAKRNEKEALKEKQKAQKAQELLDTAMQTSSLITASANIWKSLSGVPVIGPALAVAALGVMWGSFAAAKVKAASVSKETYGEGGYEILKGGSHASGNDIPIGMTRSGKQRTAEGGEALAIINKRNTAKYKSEIPNIINSLNKGTFEETYGNAFLSSEEMPPQVFNTGFDSPDLKTIESDLSEIKRRGDRQLYTDAEGNQVEVYKNVKTTYVR